MSASGSMVAPRPCKTGCSVDKRAAMPVDAGDLAAGLFDRNAGAQPSNGEIIGASARRFGPHAQGSEWSPNTDGDRRVVHPSGDHLRHYTDDLVGFAVYTQRAADDVRIGSEARVPEPLGDRGDEVLTVLILLRSEYPAENGPDTEHVKVGARNKPDH